jgi:hypothetical protein
MFYRRFVSFLAVMALALTAAVAGYAGDNNEQNATRVHEPLNLAILIQDDLTSQVSNELGVTRDFIRSLPAGSRVMVGYITAGSLQVRQPFTADLEKATHALRMPVSSTSASPFNPYVEVIEALRQFDGSATNKNAILLISDGLDTSRGFDATSAGHTLDLDRAIKQANDRNVAVYAFFAPSVGLSGRSNLAASYGQSSLKRLSHETGGQAFFQGMNGFVTFDSHFQRLRQSLNRQSIRVS